MEWNVHTYVRDNPEQISAANLRKIERLTALRDTVFFPDYAEWDYIPSQPIVTQNGDDIRSLDLGLVSVSANRRLSVRFSWWVEHEIVHKYGGFKDLIFILNEDEGWDNCIHMHLLAKRRFNVELGHLYKLLNNYEGSFEEQATACLSAIRNNYDKYASDIISGKAWDRNAWEDPRG